MSARDAIAAAAEQHGWSMEWNTGDGLCSLASKGRWALSLDLTPRGDLRSARVFEQTRWLDFVMNAPRMGLRKWVLDAMSDPAHEAWSQR